MSYDLIALEAKRPLSAAETSQLLERCRQRAEAAIEALESGEWSRLQPEGLLGGFYRRLVAAFPELNDDEDGSPWSAGLLGPWTDHLELPIAFSRTAEVCPAVLGFAAEAGVSVFDPQKQLVYHPPQVSCASQATLTCPLLLADVPAYPELIRDLVPAVPNTTDPYVVLSRNDAFYMQALWQPEGWLAEVREGGPDQHYRVEDLNAEAVVNALCSYLSGNGQWRGLGFEWVTLSPPVEG